jgi:hypothetical protein
MKEINITLDSVEVKCETRKLRAKWSFDDSALRNLGKSRLVIYPKKYRGKWSEENKANKLTITAEIKESILGMLNSNDLDDVKIGVDILKNSNVTENYNLILKELKRGKIWYFGRGGNQKEVLERYI